MKKRILLSVEAEPFDEIKVLAREIGWPKTWLSREIDKLIAGLLLVARQAKKDAEEQKRMTEEEARKRYEGLMRRFLEENR